MAASRAASFSRLEEREHKVAKDITLTHVTAEREAEISGMVHLLAQGLFDHPPTYLSHTLHIFRRMTSQENQVVQLRVRYLTKIKRPIRIQPLAWE